MTLIDMSQRFTFGGPRVQAIRGICIHTTESSMGAKAEDVAAWQASSRTGSYHRLGDDYGTEVLANTDDWTTWSTGNLGNDVLLHFSCVAQAAWSRAEWLSTRHTKMWDTMVNRVAEWCKTYGIPVDILDAPHLLQGRKGLYGHDDTRVWGGTDHTDPGPNFPWDVLRDRVLAKLNPTPAQKGPDMTVPFNRVHEAAIDDTKHAAQGAEALAAEVGAQLKGSGHLGEHPGWTAEVILRNVRAKGYDGLTLTDMVGLQIWGTDADRAAARAVGEKVK
ncbi:N-acetylmuramoyl-L-alanine amidase [Corynebacterium kalinowskii]|uniref:N-acetylmuramoyl-L-alanine amidase n=1 Tax=Corynebacterium kalinowskii TaxID=2675216 RepID=A0A6B8W0G6_9CORY|nr:N-acetylmuramoyl-L-alanine amidase [Corynebacterium kalinowskii]QGU03090.1 N-acetylmuramoyl-L-alanine amidase [Corynebacterium kalinowskii]